MSSGPFVPDANLQSSALRPGALYMYLVQNNMSRHAKAILFGFLLKAQGKMWHIVEGKVSLCASTMKRWLSQLWIADALRLQAQAFRDHRSALQGLHTQHTLQRKLTEGLMGVRYFVVSCINSVMNKVCVVSFVISTVFAALFALFIYIYIVLWGKCLQIERFEKK